MTGSIRNFTSEEVAPCAPIGSGFKDFRCGRVEDRLDQVLTCTKATPLPGHFTPGNRVFTRLVAERLPIGLPEEAVSIPEVFVRQ